VRSDEVRRAIDSLTQKVESLSSFIQEKAKRSSFYLCVMDGKYNPKKEVVLSKAEEDRETEVLRRIDENKIMKRLVAEAISRQTFFITVYPFFNAAPPRYTTSNQKPFRSIFAQ
jgi:hypothetical protein